MAKIGIRFRVQTPKGVAGGFTASEHLSIKPTTLGIKYGEESITSPVFLRKWALRSLFENTDPTTYMNEVRLRSQETAERTVLLLKTAFYDNLAQGASAWKMTSLERLARRAAFMGLTRREMLPVDDSVHYTDSIFNSAISNFTYNIDSKSSSVKVAISSNFSDKRHSDFKGLRSTYAGPSEIKLSILGLSVKNNPGQTESGKKMIVPVGTTENTIFNDFGQKVIGGKRTEAWTRKSMAVIQNGKIVYPTRSNQNPAGVPINFKDSIRTAPFYFQNPNEGNTRAVFWVQNRTGEMRFPHNVAGALHRGGLVPDAVELREIV